MRSTRNIDVDQDRLRSVTGGFGTETSEDGYPQGEGMESMARAVEEASIRTSSHPTSRPLPVRTDSEFSNNDNPPPLAAYRSNSKRLMEKKRDTLKIIVKLIYITLSLSLIVGFGFFLEQQKATANNEDTIAISELTGNAFGPISFSSSSRQDNFVKREIPDKSRYDLLKDILVKISGDYAFSDESFPQERALLWLTFHDNKQIPIPSGGGEITKLIQRYAMACLFFATNGLQWTENYNFMSGKDECDWNERDLERNFLAGVYCEKGFITKIYLSHNNLVGHVPGEIGLLSMLSEVSLYSNHLKRMSKTLELLTNLKTVYLHGNELVANLNILCEKNSFEHFRADCAGDDTDVTCKCCTECCTKDRICYQYLS